MQKKLIVGLLVLGAPLFAQQTETTTPQQTETKTVEQTAPEKTEKVEQDAKNIVRKVRINEEEETKNQEVTKQ